MSDPADLADALERCLRHQTGDPGVAVSGIRPMLGGASRDTLAFDATFPASGTARQLVVQLADPTPLRLGMPEQGRLLVAARRAGVPVADVVAYGEDLEGLGRAYLITEQVPGETIARRILRDGSLASARHELARQCGQAMAAIHRIETGAVPLDGRHPLDVYAALYEELGQPRPALELGLRWLDAHRPPAGSAVVHGDFRMGNLVVDHDGLRAVLDWELSHVGDPMEDLGWFCVRAWRFGSPLPAGGVGTYDALFRGYTDAGGAAVDPDAVRWWEIFGTLKWAVICMIQARKHLTGTQRSVELALIGRRVCENELDLLELLP